MKTNIERFDLYKNNQNRRLFISKGDKFDTSDTKKVILIHDAHNMFELEYTSYNMSWNIVDAMKKNGIDDYLIFGLECKQGWSRIREYSPMENRQDIIDQFPEGFDEPYHGQEYLEALFNNLIPYMEDKYKFTWDKTNRVMVGSSMGGVITTYAAIEYKDKFNTFMAFSNAFHANDPYIWNYIDSKNAIGRYYHDIGGKESSGAINESAKYVKGFELMNQELYRMNANFKAVFDSEAKHNELAWSKRLVEAIRWCFNE